MKYRFGDANMKYWMWVAVIWICSCMVMMGAAAQREAEAVRYWQTRLAGARMPASVCAMVSPLSSHEASQLLVNIQQLGPHYLPTHAEAFCTAAHIRCPHIQRSPAHSELEKEPKLDSTSPQNPPLGHEHSRTHTRSRRLGEFADPQNLLAFHYKHGRGRFEVSQRTAPVEKAAASDPQNLLVFYYEQEKDGSQRPQPLEKAAASDPQNLLVFYYEQEKNGSQRAQPLEKPAASDPQNLLVFYYEQDKDGSQRPQPLEKPAASDPQNLLVFYYEQEKDGSQRPQPLEKPAASDPQNLLVFYYEHEKEAGSQSAKGSQRAKALKKLTASDPQNLLAFYYEHQKEGSQRAEALKKQSTSHPQNLLVFHDEHEKEDSQSTETPLKKHTASDPQNLLVFYYDQHNIMKEDSLIGAEASQRSEPRKTPTFDPQNLLVFYYENEKEGFEPGSQRPVPLKKTPSDPQNLLVFYYGRKKEGSQRAEHLKKATSDPQNLRAFSYEHEKDGLEGSHRSVSTKKQEYGAYREISGVFFREQQVLVRGVDIHVSFAYGVDEMAEERAFLPRKLAKLFPLAAGRGPEIASKLGLLDEDLKDTIPICTATIGMHTDLDVRRCLSSIEDVADFVRSVMGDQNIDVYDAIANASSVELMNAGKTFHVLDVKKLKAELDDPAVACHDMAFPFRVFACHYVKQTMFFQATLRSAEDGSVHERIAVCHYDTSYWSPWHLSFADLNTKPGESEACHWLGAAWLHQKGWVFVRGAAAAAGTATA